MKSIKTKTLSKKNGNKIKNSKPNRWLPFIPLLIVTTLFIICLAFTLIGCSTLPSEQRGECSIAWAWLILTPIFIIAFVATIVAAILGLVLKKKFEGSSNRSKHIPSKTVKKNQKRNSNKTNTPILVVLVVVISILILSVFSITKDRKSPLYSASAPSCSSGVEKRYLSKGASVDSINREISQQTQFMASTLCINLTEVRYELYP